MRRGPFGYELNAVDSWIQVWQIGLDQGRTPLGTLAARAACGRRAAEVAHGALQHLL